MGGRADSARTFGATFKNEKKIKLIKVKIKFICQSLFKNLKKGGFPKYCPSPFHFWLLKINSHSPAKVQLVLLF